MVGDVGPDTDAELDLRGIECPLNWTRARVRLDRMVPGQRLALLVDDPRAARDIPAAAEASGFAAIEVLPCGGGWRLLIEV
jgi:TusA-related sulfurtransferase